MRSAVEHAAERARLAAAFSVNALSAGASASSAAGASASASSSSLSAAPPRTAGGASSPSSSLLAAPSSATSSAANPPTRGSASDDLVSLAALVRSEPELVPGMRVQPARPTLLAIELSSTCHMIFRDPLWARPELVAGSDVGRLLDGTSFVGGGGPGDLVGEAFSKHTIYVTCDALLPVENNVALQMAGSSSRSGRPCTTMTRATTGSEATERARVLAYGACEAVRRDFNHVPPGVTIAH